MVYGKLVVLTGVCLVVLSLAAFVGFSEISFSVLLEPYGTTRAHEVFWRLRIPRVFFGFLAGAAFAFAGVVFQSVFRNVLATPFTLGVSSGAAFGAALYFQLGFSILAWELAGSTLAALVGAGITIFFVFVLASNPRIVAGNGMLLAGVVLNFFFGSLILFVQYLSDFAEVYRISRWLMGSLDIVGLTKVSIVLPVVCLGFAGALYFSRELDTLSLGDELAASRGISLSSVKRWLFVLISVVVGVVVALSGPIGFVGIMVPHFCRVLVGYRHRILLWVSFLVGGVFLVVCDALSRVVIAPAEIPVGIITALLGGPFFLWVFVRKG